MVKTIDRERMAGMLKRERYAADMLSSAGTGIIASCLFSPSSGRRTLMILVGFVMICAGWYKRARYDRKVMQYVESGE